MKSSHYKYQVMKEISHHLQCRYRQYIGIQNENGNICKNTAKKYSFKNYSMILEEKTNRLPTSCIDLNTKCLRLMTI